MNFELHLRATYFKGNRSAQQKTKVFYAIFKAHNPYQARRQSVNLLSVEINVINNEYSKASIIRGRKTYIFNDADLPALISKQNIMGTSHSDPQAPESDC